MAMQVLVLGTGGWQGPEDLGPISVDGVDYATLVHWIEADKARAVGADAVLSAVLEAPGAQRASEAGDAIDDPSWERVEALQWGLLHLMLEDVGLAGRLEATGDDQLVVVDDVWGIGPGADPEHSDTWSADNLLGRALMQVRAARRSELPKQQPFGHDIFGNPRPVLPVHGPASEPDAMTPKRILFGFDGHLGARDFLIGHGLAMLLGGGAFAFVPSRHPIALLVGLPVVVALYGWMVAALYTKRVGSVLLGGVLAVVHTMLVVGTTGLPSYQGGTLLGWGAVGLVLAACFFPTPRDGVTSEA